MTTIYTDDTEFEIKGIGSNITVRYESLDLSNSWWITRFLGDKREFKNTEVRIHTIRGYKLDNFGPILRLTLNLKFKYSKTLQRAQYGVALRNVKEDEFTLKFGNDSTYVGLFSIRKISLLTELLSKLEGDNIRKRKNPRLSIKP